MAIQAHVQAPTGKYQTPRVPIETPLLGADGHLDRTWVVFLERLGRYSTAEAIREVAAVADYEYATFAIYNTTVASNVTNLLPVRRGGTLVDCEIVPKTDTAGDFELDILANAGAKPFSSRISIFGNDKLFVPSGTPKGTIIKQTVFLDNPGELLINDVLSSDVLTGGSADVYTAVLKWQV